MTPERWQRIEELFNQSAELPLDERTLFLDHACAADPDLRREVETLLAVDASQTAIQSLQEVVNPADLERAAAPRHIGPWQITGIIGTGGMGTVYVARRDDGLFAKQVAIKVLRLGLESEFALARFRYERRILGGLEHPQIARLIDGGELEGRPYIVMEFVEGVPVTDYCREHALTLDARIALFRNICAAVQYAHQRLVIHRDLKPSNILVAADGTVKLLDFGIAKLEDPDVETDLAAQTSTAMRMMTPEYASPEQVRGEAVTAASDVYALGAVLFELLTATKAHRLTRQDPAELLRVICEQVVPAPSVVAPVEWQRPLRGDLDNIVGKALQKESERRYQSVEQLSDDLRAYLEGRPVSARADTTAYRVGKFLRRNRWTSALVALLVLSLMAGAGFSLYQARRAERRFEQVRGLARAFLFDVNDEIENLPGATRARQILVSTASTYLNSLAAEAGGDRALSLEVAAAYQKVGDVLGDYYRANLGREKEALENYRKSLLIAEPVAKGTQDAAAWRLVAWGDIKSASISKDGLPQLKAGLEIAKRIGSWTGKPETALVMDAHRGIGDVVFRTVGWGAALQEYESCLAAAEGAAVHLEGRLEEIRTRCLQRAGKAQAATGDLDGAMIRFREARAKLLERVRAEPGHLEHRRNLLIVLIECARWTGNPNNQNLGDLPTATAYALEAVEVARSLRTVDPNDALGQRNEVAALVSLSEITSQGKLGAAQEWLREATARTANLSPGPRAMYNEMLADVRGRIQQRLGRYVEAQATFEANLGLTSRRTPHDFTWRVDMSVSRMRLADLQLAMGSKDAAAKLYKAEVPELEALLRERPDEFYLVFYEAKLFQMLAECENSAEWARRSAGVWAAWTAGGGKGDWAVRQRTAAEESARHFAKVTK